MSEEELKLKPCPFCPYGRGSVHTSAWQESGVWCFSVECDTCGANIYRMEPVDHRLSDRRMEEVRHNVVRTWNNRPGDKE